MMPLMGEPVIRHVLRRCQKIPGIDFVVCAVPSSEESLPIEYEAEKLDIRIFRGSENDVLARYHDAATLFEASHIVRVTSDCPTIDPAVCGDVLSLLISSQADYASNNIQRTFPHGLDCEAFTIEALARAHSEATAPEQREHVTPWMRENSGCTRANLWCTEAEQKDQRWTLDREEDYRFFQALFDHLPLNALDWRTVVNTIESSQDLVQLQKACRLAS